MIQTPLTPETTTTLYTAAAVACALFTAYAWLMSRLNRIDRRLEKIEGGHRESWPYTSMKLWALQLKSANPALAVPEPERPPEAGHKEE